MNLAAIDLNLLLVLDALLQETHVTRAGRRVGLSQPATSSALNRLRHIFGDQLMERVGRRMQLTARAHQLRGPLREALDQLGRVVTVSEQFDPSTAEFSVRILASDQIAFILLPALRAKLRELAPRVELVFTWSDRANTFDLLIDDRIDFAIGVYGDAPHQCQRTLLFDDDIVVQARKGHPAFRGKLTLERFLKYPRVAISFEGRASSYLETALARAGAASRSEIVVAHLLNAPLLTWDSDLMTVVPIRMARRLSAMMELDWRPVPFAIDPLRIELLWRARAEIDPALTWFRGLLVEVASAL